HHKALIIFLHGMNACPNQFKTHLQIYEKNDQLALFAPYIYNKGLAPINETGQQLLSTIPDTQFEIPVFLVGISNGGRLCLWLYKHLKPRFSEVYITTLGAPINGTYMANLALK